ncbi:MAG: DUF3892 domain-containing protein [Burkholderiaceae bacterium]
MASSIRVQCINKTDRYNAHERIKNIGGVKPDGTQWKLAEPKAIEGIENGTWSFYVQAGGRIVSVIIAKSRYGNKYLKTEADGEQPDNLLSLPECP